MNTNNKQLLVVDDIKDVRDGISSILKDEGYHVITARDGIKALKELENNKIDLVVTDILMPDMDGLELVTTAKALYPELIFILISGGGSKGNSDAKFSYIDSAQKLTGEKNVLKKPFKPEALIEMIEKLFSN